MNLQLHHVIADITAATGMRIIRAILAGERNPEVLARLRDYRCHSSAETIEKALTGSYRAEHLFALEQALALYEAYHEKVSACDVRIEAVLKELSIDRGRRSASLPSSRRRTDQANGLRGYAWRRAIRSPAGRCSRHEHAVAAAGLRRSCALLP
jgi:transposase